MTKSKTECVALALDLTVYLKRHTDIFAGAVRFADQQTSWTCVIDDFVESTLVNSSRGTKPYQGIVGRASEKLVLAAKRRRVPLVNVWRGSPVSNLYGVYPDFSVAGEIAVQHLLDRGVRKLACIYRGNDPAEGQLAGRFKMIADEASCQCELIPVSIKFAHTLSAWEKTRNQINGWLDSVAPPVGVFTSIDILGRHVAQLANENRLMVPRDVAIVSAHNEPMLCLHPEPSLSSIEYGFDHIGYEAAKVLHQLMHGEKPNQKEVLIPPRELVIRRSSDFIFINDEIVSLAMQFISQNSRKSIGVDMVARQVNVSRRTLEKKFACHLGHTVAAEIRRVRIDHAKRLLAGSALTITQIARATGFVTSNQLARVFRREVEMSPREYRVQRRAD